MKDFDAMVTYLAYIGSLRQQYSNIESDMKIEGLTSEDVVGMHSDLMEVEKKIVRAVVEWNRDVFVIPYCDYQTCLIRKKCEHWHLDEHTIKFIKPE